MAPRPLNVGLVGGGGGAFIVQPHQAQFTSTALAASPRQHCIRIPKLRCRRRSNGRTPLPGIAATTK